MRTWYHLVCPLIYGAVQEPFFFYNINPSREVSVPWYDFDSVGPVVYVYADNGSSLYITNDPKIY